MLIGLLTLLFTVVLGNDGSPFVLPKAEKTVKHVLADSENKKEILAEMKTFKKQWKKLQKTKKRQAKGIVKLNKDFYVNQQLIDDRFRKYRTERGPLKEQLTNLRLAVQGKFTSEEWAQLMARAINPDRKTTKKMNKAEAKAEMRRNKQLTAIADEIEAAFEDPEAIEEVKQDIETFEDSMADLLVGGQGYLDQLVEVMENQDATREELQALVDREEEIRVGAHNSFLTLRSNLIELSNESHWPKLAKPLNKLIK